MRRTRGVRLPTHSLAGALLFLAPAVILVLLFKFWPIAVAVLNSGQIFDLAGQPLGWVGLEHYQRATNDEAFRDSLVLTLAFVAVKLPLQLAFGLIVAQLVLRPGRLNRVVRSVIFVPTVTSIIVVGVLFSFLFDREIGIVNAVLSSVGIDKAPWLLEPRLAQLVMLTLSLWRDTGFVMLVFLAGLQSIPEELLEAARLDGSTWWQEFAHVTVPLLQRSVQFATVFITLAAFQFFAPIYAMTRGGPRGATDVVAYHLYETAFDFFDWGLASAMSVVIVALLIVITAVELRVLRPRWEY
jgi:multiple sugar transport system permease protein